MHSSEIRDTYLRFFEGKGHLIAPSDSLTPDDPTLLFTSAGMVQFKAYFTGDRMPPSKRMTTSQKCLRTGDLDIVGTTRFHHTFFEMLGNFSFGDYFKREAITWAWEFLTQVMKLPAERFAVTVYLTDDEAAGIWENEIGLPKNRIYRMGEKSNFWPSNAPSLGPNGPCGPCSEIFYDFGEDVGCRRPECDPDCDCGRYAEVWNLVFTQYNREDGGILTPLPMKNIDTGMGFERITAVIQGVWSNFDTDLFQPIIKSIADRAGVTYGVDDKVDVSLRVIADHLRAAAFTIADGVMPSNVGRGYVLRRIIRRATLKGKGLGMEDLFLADLAPVIVNLMGDAYPEVRERIDHVRRTVRIEEERFRRTLDMGLQKLEDSIDRLSASGATEIPGMEAFVLYDTYGFPLESTQEIAQERGLTVDVQGFNEAMEEQRRKAREGSDVPSGLFVSTLGALAEIEKVEPASEFVGYTAFSSPAKIVGVLKGGELVLSASTGEKVDIVLDKTPFYAEMGGQVADVGLIKSDTGVARVSHTAKVGTLIVHTAEVASGSISTGETVSAEVDAVRRMSTQRNHTATHLLHRALRMLLGEHVVQAGSLVEPSRYRFDFVHQQAVTPAEIEEIEKIVNAEILRDQELNIYETTLEEAKNHGAMALFGEKYSGVVRVVKVGDFSMELCGGTHVQRTSQIGMFKITSESSVGAGLRRFEGVTGAAAIDYMNERERLLGEIASSLRVSPSDAPEAVARLAENLKAAEKEISELRQKTAASQADGLASSAEEINGIKLIAARVDVGDVDVMSALADSLAQKLGSGIVVLGGPTNGKVMLVCKVTKDLVERKFSAGNLIREIAKVTGGGGGGRPDFAQAGGKDPDKLGEALAKAKDLVAAQAG